MKKRWYSIQALAEARVAKVAIRGVIGDWGTSDEDLIRDITEAGEIDEIHVSINSRGGDATQGLSIYNYLRTHPALVTVRIDGMAASAASIVAMAADTIIMPANTLMMVHNPWTIVVGNAAELRKAANDLDKFESSLVQTYLARTGKTEVEIRELLDNDTYMTADEAKALGFADVVEPLTKPAAMAFAEALDVPATVLARMQAMETVEPTEPASTSCAADLAKLCHEHGATVHAAAWIAEGISVEVAAKRILAERAAEDASTNIDKTILSAIENPAANIKTTWATAFANVKKR